MLFHCFYRNYTYNKIKTQQISSPHDYDMQILAQKSRSSKTETLYCVIFIWLENSENKNMKEMKVQ